VLSSRIVKYAPEKVFINVFNNEAATNLVAGDVAVWENGLVEGPPPYAAPTATNGAGVRVTKSTAALHSNVAGVAIGTIAFQTYGLLQVYGFHAAVKASGAITAGIGTYVKTGGAVGAVVTSAIDAGDGAFLGPCVVTAAGGFVGVQLKLL
jgi:hypothetical protein